MSDNFMPRWLPNTLPNSWVLAAFDEVVDAVSDNGKRIKLSAYLDKGAIPVVDQGEGLIGGYTNDTDKMYNGRLPVVIFGDHTRRVKYVEFPFAVGAEGVKLFRSKACLMPKLLAYFLPELGVPDRGYSRHSQFLHKFLLPIAPLPEQHRIVAEIEKQFTRLDAAVVALKRAKANLKRYRASVLQAACEGRLVSTEAELARAEGREYEPADRLVERILKERRARWEADQLAKMQATGREPNGDGWKAKYQEPAAPDTSNLPSLPKGWVWATTAQLVTRSEYGTSVRCSYAAGGEPVLRIPNIAAGRIDLAEVKHSTLPLNLDPENALQAGDLLMCRTNGSISLIGRVAVVRTPILPLHTFASYLLRFRFAERSVLPRWIESFMVGPRGRAFIETNAASSAGQHNISLTLIHGMVLALPPLAEQQRIVAEVERRLSLVDGLEIMVQHSLTRADRLRQSILKRAFEGKLVPQDPNDEPASVLLERILAERENTTVVETGRGRGRGRRAWSK